MDQQLTLTELIETASQSLKADGITVEYIKQLSCTWNSLERYLATHNLPLIRKTVQYFRRNVWHIF